MQLKDIKTFVVGNPPPHFGGPWFVFVKLTTNDNVSGIGESYGVPFHPDLVARLLEDVFGRYLEGQDPHDIEALTRRVYSSGFTQHPDLTTMGVFSALEMACWDIIGKAAGEPVYRLLGGQVHERLRSYTYIYPRPDQGSEIYHDAALSAERAHDYLRQGFTALKFDPAGPYSAFDGRQLSLEALDRCEQFVRVLREAVGSRADLLFGTHGQMTAAGAIRLARRLERYDPLWFEEPVPPDSPEGDGQSGARARPQFRLPPGSDWRRKYDFARLLRAGSSRHLANEPGPGWRPARGEEDRRHGRDPACADRAASVLRPGGWCGQCATGHLQPEFPDAGEHRALAGFSQRHPEKTDLLAGWLRDPAHGGRTGRRTQ